MTLASKQKRLSNFINKSTKIHNNKYMYKNSIYENTYTKITITCKKHGDFKQLIHNHLKGAGCPKCSNLKRKYMQQKSFKHFAIEGNRIHNNCYIYDKKSYNGAKKPMTIKCKIHGNFICTPDHHINRRDGCPFCGEIIRQIKQNKTRFASLYIIYIKKYNVYKIGATSKKIHYRFATDFNFSEFKNDIELIYFRTFDVKKAFTIEQFILSQYKQYMVKDKNILKYGNNEILNSNVNIYQLIEKINTVINNEETFYEKY